MLLIGLCLLCIATENRTEPIHKITLILCWIGLVWLGLFHLNRFQFGTFTLLQTSGCASENVCVLDECFVLGLFETNCYAHCLEFAFHFVGQKPEVFGVHTQENPLVHSCFSFSFEFHCFVCTHARFCLNSCCCFFFICRSFILVSFDISLFSFVCVFFCSLFFIAFDFAIQSEMRCQNKQK